MLPIQQALKEYRPRNLFARYRTQPLQNPTASLLGIPMMVAFTTTNPDDLAFAPFTFDPSPHPDNLSSIRLLAQNPNFSNETVSSHDLNLKWHNGDLQLFYIACDTSDQPTYHPVDYKTYA